MLLSVDSEDLTYSGVAVRKFSQNLPLVGRLKINIPKVAAAARNITVGTGTWNENSPLVGLSEKEISGSGRVFSPPPPSSGNSYFPARRGKARFAIHFPGTFNARRDVPEILSAAGKPRGDRKDTRGDGKFQVRV